MLQPSYKKIEKIRRNGLSSDTALCFSPSVALFDAAGLCGIWLVKNRLNLYILAAESSRHPAVCLFGREKTWVG
ncbi:MAG: hypothetical protein HW380_1389 [Magnetococcales bacterium]|nr:hypothetical protein [Magnetococcales bacterium]